MSVDIAIASYVGTEWGGSPDPSHNIYAWFWAIAEGGSPADLDALALADDLGCSVFEAYAHITKAERIFRASVNQNRRSALYQEYARSTRKTLQALATRRGLVFSGFDTKAELIQRLLDSTIGHEGGLS